MTQTIGMGLVGPGFIARHHIDAVRRLGNVEVVGITGSSAASAGRKAALWGVPRGFESLDAMLLDPAIDVVHNTTPSYLHFATTMAILRAGKHVVSDKPLANTSEECVALRDAARQAGVVNAVTFNYRGNPMVQQARAMIAEGELGPLVFVHGQYLQDWMTDDRVYSWRMDPATSGPSSALADIGSHWCDLAEHITGLRIAEVLADLTTAVPVRYSSGSSGEAFAVASDVQGTPVRVTGEDVASVLLRFENGTRGTLKVGQVLPGHKNDLQLEINGRKASLRWLQEQQNELWIGKADAANQVLDKSPALLRPEAVAYAQLPGGHQESWADAFRNVIADIYRVIRGEAPGPTFCSFAQAYRTSCIVDAMLRSHATGGTWQRVQEAVAK